MHSLLLLLLAATAAADKLPKTWKTCLQETKSERDHCLVDAITGAVNDLMNGSRPLGVLPLDPLRFTTIGIESTGPVAVDLQFIDIDLHNIKSFEVSDVNSDLKGYQIEIKGKLKEPLIIVGYYRVKGKVLILPIVGDGKCNITFENFSFKLNLTGHEKYSQNYEEKFFDAQKGAVDINTSRMTVKFENLFNGDKRLGDNMNKFLNDNWDVILTELLGPVSQAFGDAIRLIANRVFHKIELKNIAPQ